MAAIVRATFYTIDNRSEWGATMPAYEGDAAVRVDDLSTNGASQIMQSGGGNWTAPRAGYVRIRATAAVDLKIGAPSGLSVASGAGIPLAAEESIDLSIKAGQAIAVYGLA